MMYREQIEAEIEELERKNRRYKAIDTGAYDNLALAIEQNERPITALKKLLPKAKHIKYADKFVALLRSATKCN